MQECFASVVVVAFLLISTLAVVGMVSISRPRVRRGSAFRVQL